MSIGWARVIAVPGLVVAGAAVILLLIGAYFAGYAAMFGSTADSSWIKPVISLGFAELAVVSIAFVGCLVGSSRGLLIASIGTVVVLALGLNVLWLLATRDQGLPMTSVMDLGLALLFILAPGITLLLATLAMRAARAREAEQTSRLDGR